MNRRHPKHQGPFVCYVACLCCGHWWPLREKMFRALIDPMRFVCPLCAAGRKHACDDWDQVTRRPPIPERLDVRIGTVESLPKGCDLFGEARG